MHLRHVHDTREISGLKNPMRMPLAPGWNNRCAATPFTFEQAGNHKPAP